MTNTVLIDRQNWSEGTTTFAWLMIDGRTVVGLEIICVNVTSSSPRR